MIKHIVMWDFKTSAEGKSRRENMEIVRDALLALTSEISEIKSMEIGFDLSGTDASADICLVTEFDSLDTLKIYAEHPKHLAVASYVRLVAESRKVIDYEI
jgi:hypothetical protein